MKVTPKLGKILKERGMTQVELAVKANVPQAAVSRFDRASQGSYTNIIAIARALGIHVEDMFEIENE